MSQLSFIYAKPLTVDFVSTNGLMSFVLNYL